MFTYLAIPYSHTSPERRAFRMTRFWDAAAMLTRMGERVVSPMLLEPMQLRHPDTGSDWESWKDYSAKLMGVCDKVVILMLDGWRESDGVAGEIVLARGLGLPIQYLEGSAPLAPQEIGRVGKADCLHPQAARTDKGEDGELLPRYPLRFGSGAVEVCTLCGMWRMPQMGTGRPWYEAPYVDALKTALEAEEC